MSRGLTWLVHASTVLVGGTGLVYAWMRYLLRPVDEFALVNHPWQVDVQHAHILFAPILVFACGLIWRAHVWARWRGGFRARRRTGIALALLLAPMVLSGYLVQTAEDEGWRMAAIVSHSSSSLLWLLLYGIHQWLPNQLQQQALKPHQLSRGSDARPATKPPLEPPAEAMPA